MFKVLLLNISKTYSDSDCWETNLRVSPFKGDQHHDIIQMAQEQHAIYFGYAFLAVLGKFYRIRKGLKLFLAMHINNQKWSFDIFTVLNIFMEHDLNI